MRLTFSNPQWLWLLPPVLAWTLWLAWRSDASLNRVRRITSLTIRLIAILLLIGAVAGAQWYLREEGMNVFFLLDRSDSIPSAQQEQARAQANLWVKSKPPKDKAGFLIFGADAALESEARTAADREKIQAVVDPERTDIAGAIRLASAALQETGQRKLVLFSDGNENSGDALTAVNMAHSQAVTVDVVPMGVRRVGDVSVQKIGLPSKLKKGQTFEAKIFATSDQPRKAKLKLLRNDQLLGEQTVQLEAGKNLFTLPQTLSSAGFYSYEVQLETPDDPVPQNNKANGFVMVREGQSILIVSSDPSTEGALVAALREKMTVKLTDVRGFPGTLPELQSYDEIILSNVAAGDMGREMMQLLESAVRDFGVGLVCIGGDQSYAAGGYRNTPLEEVLPVEMELSSKKVLPKGALGLVMHGMEFANGNQVARGIALAALDSLGPLDEMGVWLWDGNEHPLFSLQAVGDRRDLARKIAAMNQGDLPDFQGLMTLANADLQKSTANLKHLIVFSDGDPNAPTAQLMADIVKHKITVSTVMIGGHVQPTTMMNMAELGHGRFYDVKSAAQLPKIFIKEASIILKSAIVEETFVPQVAAPSEIIRGIQGYPALQGYVATSTKARAETPLLTDKGDPLLAHWQFGLGRAVAFTSDANAKWARDWVGWGRYQQFWTQVANWALRRVEPGDFTTEVSVENGDGTLSVEALDAQGNFRNFLNLRVSVVTPKGEKTEVPLQQTGPGRYEGKFPTREVGAYSLNLGEFRNGARVSSQVVGASVNYSPEFNAVEPDIQLLRRIAEAGGGAILNPASDNPFLMGRKKTYHARDLWEDLLKCFVCLFVFDVGVRRVDFDREEWGRWFASLRRRLGLGDHRSVSAPPEALGSLLASRDRIRAERTGSGTAAAEKPILPRADLFQPKSVPVHDQQAKSTTSQPADSATDTNTTPTAQPEPPKGTASRLLDAKKRAKRP